MKKRFISTLILSVVLISILTSQVFASSYGAYAIYRDKLYNPTMWHGGMVIGDLDDDECIVHKTDSTDVVKVSMAEFMDFKETYRISKPNGTMSITKMDAVTTTAIQLTRHDIDYVLDQQIEYDSDCYGHSMLDYEDIDAIRCDGVIEYCYEYNGVRIYGNDSYWNISIPSSSSLSQHSSLAINPKTQAQDYMTRVNHSGTYTQ